MDKAESARRFFGSERTVLMYDSLLETEMFELSSVTSIYSVNSDSSS